MASSGKFTNEGNARLLSLIFKIGSPTIPSAVYLGLTTAVVDEDDTLATITEVSDAGYSRQPIVFSTPSEISDKMLTNNTTDLVFGNFVYGGIAVTHAFITDAPSGTSGTLIACYDLGTTKYTNSGDVLTVPANVGLIMNLD
jgi:hypothetical protein